MEGGRREGGGGVCEWRAVAQCCSAAVCCCSPVLLPCAAHHQRSATKRELIRGPFEYGPLWSEPVGCCDAQIRPLQPRDCVVEGEERSGGA